MASDSSQTRPVGRSGRIALLIGLLALAALAVAAAPAAAQDDECVLSDESNCERVGSVSFGEDASLGEAVLHNYYQVSPIYQGATRIANHVNQDRPCSEAELSDTYVRHGTNQPSNCVV